MFHWDPTISAGNLVSAASIIGGIFLAYTKLRERLIAIETQLEPLWKEFTERRTTTRRQGDRN